MFERGLDGLRRDFIKHHAKNILAGDNRLAFGDYLLDRLLGFLLALLFALFLGLLFFLFELFLRGEFELGSAQHIGQMRANSFALAVWIARQIDGVGGRGGLLQRLHDIALARAHFVRRFETVRDIDAQFLLGQVHHVPVRRLDRIVAAEIFIDRLRFCGRFDDD